MSRRKDYTDKVAHRIPSYMGRDTKMMRSIPKATPLTLVVGVSTTTN